MLLTGLEEDELAANLWATAEIWKVAFGECCPLARLLSRVIRALDRGEAVQRQGGWRREANSGFRTTDR